MDLALILNLATTTAVVGGVIFGAWQLRVAARTRATQIALHMMETLYSPQMVDGLMSLRAVPDGLSVADLEKQLGDHWNNAFAAMTTFDAMGMLVYRGELSFTVADDFFHHSVALVWEKCRRAAVDVRVERGDERLLEYLQWLAEKQKASPDHAARPAYLTARTGRR